MIRRHVTKRLAAHVILATVACVGVAEKSAKAQTPGNCVVGTATTDLDVGNVRARLYNNGGLFGGSDGFVYNVPAADAGTQLPTVISGIWIVGRTSQGLKKIANTFQQRELWPGPLSVDGRPPADCSIYDRIYLVSRDDVAEFDSSGESAIDLAEWPVDLGAPVVDGDGIAGNYDLHGGDRPDIEGDQMAWWIMNDSGNEGDDPGLPPIGLEIRASASAFAHVGDLRNSTIYRFKLTHRGTERLRDARFAFWSYVNLGDYGDDYVASDTTLRMAYVYNLDNFDEPGYGAAPPALGFDILQGPLVPAAGRSFRDPDGTVHPDSTRLPMTSFLEYNGDDPAGTNDYYNYMQGIWKDGTPMCEGGYGYPWPNGFECTGVARFMYPGDPVTGEFWSERNLDGNGTANPYGGSSWMVMSTGPFNMDPGETQEFVVAIVWARGRDNLDSITELRKADAMIQRAFDLGFNLPDGPPAPTLSSVETNGGPSLRWSSDNTADIEDYEAASPFSVGPDLTYNFEGYEVYQFASADFDPATATLLATFDVRNGVGEVREEDGDGVIHVLARGTDSGVEREFVVEGLRNYTEYYFGVQPYAYNGDTEYQRVLRGEMATITVVPTGVDDTFSLADIGIVPNPYKGASDYEVSTGSNFVRFTGMPEVATIQVYTISGALVTKLEKDSPERYFEWDLTNEFGRKIGSGVYLVHIDVPGVGSRVVKLGVVIGGKVTGVQ